MSASADTDYERILSYGRSVWAEFGGVFAGASYPGRPGLVAFFTARRHEHEKRVRALLAEPDQVSVRESSVVFRDLDLACRRASWALVRHDWHPNVIRVTPPGVDAHSVAR